ncbi:hypothetical protein CHUAL_004140 [Chamberlinius hualienensis]
MKIWSNEHIFNHPWETVTQAAWRKYPNPMNPAVVGIDVMDRKVEDGILHTHRLICTKFGLPAWTNKFLGKDRTCYVSEYSEVDPITKTMTLQSRNLSLCNYLSVDEKLTYSQHPTNKNCTLLKQEAVVSIRGIPLTNYLEDKMTSTISANANKGRLAMEYVIGKINTEVQELTSAVKSMDEISRTTMDDLTRAAKSMGNLQQNFSKIPKL